MKKGSKGRTEQKKGVIKMPNLDILNVTHDSLYCTNSLVHIHTYACVHALDREGERVPYLAWYQNRYELYLLNEHVCNDAGLI